MRVFPMLLLTSALAVTSLSGAAAETANPNSQGAACPPDVRRDAPVVGRESNKPLSDQLADSKGVICPPAGVDPQMQQRPPEGGAMKVIPPPGAPGGDQSVQPK